MGNKVYIVIESGYNNVEYWDTWSDIESIHSSREKAVKHIESIEGITKCEDRETWKIGDEDEDAYEVKFYEIREEEVK